jgi:uncharacterized protein
MDRVIEDKLNSLREIFLSMNRVIVAYSGGVDSTFLLKVARDTLGDRNVIAVTALSPLYPERELRGAKEVAQKLGVKHLLIESNELKIEGFSKNPPDRCYLCKRELFSELRKFAQKENISYIVEGSTLDDEKDHRPGRKAIQEYGIRSPLVESLLFKEEIRKASKSMGLSTWDKPSFACLASRFPYYDEITEEGLRMVNEAEEFLAEIGFKQVRVRHYKDLARIEVYKEEIGKFLEDKTRERVVKYLKKIGYHYITLDLQGFRSGSMNEVLE